MKKQVLFCILLCFVTACTKEIEIPINGFERKMVINSLFSPDKPFKFYFSYTVRPTEVLQTKISDSIHLWLYEDKKQILDTVFLSDSLISTYYPIREKVYELKVFVAGYDTIFACDTVPMEIGITEAYKKLISVDRYRTYTYHTTVTFFDPPDINNYYEIFFGKNRSYNSNNKYYDPVLINEGDEDFYPDTYFFSDKLFDGQKYSIHINRELGFNTVSEVSFHNISYHYYMYRKYWVRHSYNQILRNEDDGIGIGILFYKRNPLSMYNNIINGYGIFAAYIANEPFPLKDIK